MNVYRNGRRRFQGFHGLSERLFRGGARPRGGYILVETIVSMGLLSISMYMIYGGVRNAVAAEGQSRDFTTARLILDEVVATLEMPAQLRAHSGQETYFERFRAAWKVEEVSVPKPELPYNAPPSVLKKFEEEYVDYICKIRVEIAWTRAGQPYKIVGESLLSPARIYKAKGHAF